MTDSSPPAVGDGVRGGTHADQAARALKLLHGEFTRSAGIVTRFLREVSAAGCIGNAHVVEAFDAGRLDAGEPYIVKQLLQGHTLGVGARQSVGARTHDVAGLAGSPSYRTAESAALAQRTHGVHFFISQMSPSPQ